MPQLPEPELWADETIAEFLLNNAMGEDDYREAIAEVLAMGIDPISLNPEHVIIGDRPWRRPELYLDTVRSKQTV
jgi:hypothetical protein